MGIRPRLLVCVVALLAISACGANSAVVPSPSPSASPSFSPYPSASPSPSPSPSPRPVAAGAPGWVTVSVASGWRSPESPRPADYPVLENPVRIRDWVAAMTAASQAGLIDRLDTQLLLGDEVEVLEVKGVWARVVVPDQATPLDPRGYPVWIPVRQLTATPPPDTTEAVTVTAPVARLLSAGGTLEVGYGTTLPVLNRDGATYTVGLPDGRVMTVDARSVSAPAQAATAGGVIAAARSLLSVPYIWGGTSAFGLDCSGLVHLVYKANGVIVPRDSDPQSKFGTAVERSALQPGDLVFFSSGGIAYHVAIYAGGGMVIQSPAPGQKVELVALNSLAFAGDYSGARRVIGTVAPPSPTPTPTAPRLPSSLSGAEWTALPTGDKVVALTFDAGGNNAGVAPILKALAGAGVPATFFLTGRWAEVYPNDAKLIAATFPVANHTYSHPYLTKLTDANVKDQIVHAETVIKTTTGHDPRPLFRFPYGDVDSRVLADAHALGYGGIRWTVDTLGWKGGGAGGQSEATVLARVLGSLRPGEIVLMHVGAANDGSTLDASALPAVISAVQARGYHFVLVGDYAR